MAKNSGSTKNSTSRNPKGLSGGGNFPSTAKLSDFEAYKGGSGSVYTMNRGGFELSIETSHGYNDDIGSDGTTIEVSIRKGTGKTEWLASDFVEGRGLTASMGQKVYTNDPVRKKIEGMMPLYIEKANNWKKKNS